jgi:hypothetical protein
MISSFRPGFGFGGPDDPAENKTINIVIAGNTYGATESTTQSKSFGFFMVDIPNFTITAGSHSIIPGVTNTSSYQEYLDNKVIIIKILSTFRSTDQTSTDSSPASPSTTYIVPSTWTKTTFNGLSLCLPPKWEVGNDGIYFNRDASYRPMTASLQEIPYSSGSRRQAYLDYWKSEYPDVENLVSFSEIPIGQKSALLINPTTNEVKESPEGLAVIWLAQSNLWKASLSGWQMVNDSKSAYLNDIYTMISCSF